MHASCQSGVETRDETHRLASDIDVLDVLEGEAAPERTAGAFRDLSYDVMLEYGPIVERHIRSKPAFDQSRDRWNPFIETVGQKGINGRNPSMYVLQVKETAVEANPFVAELVARAGQCHEFESRTEAEALAEELSQDGGRVRVQKAAPQDPAAVDGYLVPFPRQFHQQPKETGKVGLTFDVGANLYGELGRALIHGTYGLSPALRYYFYEKVDGVDREIHRLNGVPQPHFPDGFDADVSWSPDLLVRTYRRGPNELDGLYFGEIKTGEASFQRGQLEDMRRVAEEFGVLKIRVAITDLPAEYTVKIDVVG